MKRLLFSIMIVLVAAASAGVAGSEEGDRPLALQSGILLAATPSLEDPNFIHTVILVVSYRHEGTIGLIINRPSGIDLKEVFPFLNDIEDGINPIYLGGPVDRNGISILFESDAPAEGSVKVLGNIYFADHKDVVLPILQNPLPDQTTRIFAGLASWAHGQLEQEIRRGAWKLLKGSEEMIFSDNPLHLWPSIYPLPPEDFLVHLNTGASLTKQRPRL